MLSVKEGAAIRLMQLVEDNEAGSDAEGNRECSAPTRLRGRALYGVVQPPRVYVGGPSRNLFFELLSVVGVSFFPGFFLEVDLGARAGEESLWPPPEKGRRRVDGCPGRCSRTWWVRPLLAGDGRGTDLVPERVPPVARVQRFAGAVDGAQGWAP